MLTSITNRLNTFLLVLSVLIGVSIIAILATRAGAGPLDPPGAPGSTGRNVIFQPASCAGFPITISQAGSYVLGGDITGCPGADGIDITTSNVTLDLDGHIVSGGGNGNGSLTGIKNAGANGQLSIGNGQVQQWGGSGIDLTGSSVARVDHIVATYNGASGVIIDSTSTVTNATTSANTGYGIKVIGTDNSISGCQSEYNGHGIYLPGSSNLVEDCEVASNNAHGITGGSVERIVHNHVHHNKALGISVGDSSDIEDNGVQWNGTGGVSCSSDCSLVRNTINSNTGDGVYLTGGVGVVADNQLFGNTAGGLDILAPVAGYPNVIARNVSTGNAGGNYNIGANNDAGPQTTAAGAGAAATTNVSQ